MHTTEIRVEWFDVDRENVVYFGNYFRFFSAAEDAFLRSIGLSHNVIKERFGVGFTRIEARCSYKRPVRYEDLIEVETRAELENGINLTFAFRVFRKNEQNLLAEGNIKTACVKLGDEFSVVTMPEEVKARLRQAITDGENRF